MHRTQTIKKILSLLFYLQQIGKSTDLKWVLGYSALLGVLYGIFVNPLWSEAVDFGQVWAGLINYNKSPWGGTVFGAPSLQIYIPALLLLAGFPIWPLCLIATSFFCAISFSAVAATSFAFTRNIIISISFALIFLSYTFANSHGYPVAYPVGYFQFGQTGQYVALLAFALLACGWPRAAGVFGGLLSGVHSVWCICFFVGAFPITAWSQPKLLKRLSYSFTLSVILSIGFMYYAETVLTAKSQYHYMPPIIPSSALSAVSKSENLFLSIADKNNTTTTISQPNSSGKDIKPAQKIWRGHAVVFTDVNSPINAALTFFLPEIIFCLLYFSFYSLRRIVPSQSQYQFDYSHKLLSMFVLPLLFAFIYQIMGQVDPSYSIFGAIHNQLPALAIRAIFNRWFNLTSLLIPIMVFGVLFTIVRYKKSWPCLIALIVLYIFAMGHSSFALVPSRPNYNLLVLGLFVIFTYLTANKWSVYIETEKNKLFAIAIAVCCLFISFKCVKLAYYSFTTKKYTGSDAVEPLVEKAQKGIGPILISSEVVATNNFNPQLRTKRPIIVPTELDVYDKNTKTIIHVFCSNNDVTFEHFYAQIQSCFEQRPIWQWETIKKETQATGIITPSYWKLQMAPVISAGGFAYYDLERNNS